MKLDEIKINKNNPRTIKSEKMDKLKRSIEQFPKMMELRPIVIDNNKMILGGNMRYLALKELGHTEIPDEWIKFATQLTEDEKQRFIIEDNVGFGDWDWEKLANEWDEIELDDWGLDIPEMEYSDNLEAKEDDYEIPDEIKTDILLGDIFQIGEHRLMCGDSTDAEQVAKLMNGEKADMVFTDPPYSVNYTKKTKEIFHNNNYTEIRNDNMSVEETANNIWRPFFQNCYKFSKNNCSIYCTMPQGGDQMMMMMMMMGEKWKVKHELIWLKEAPVFSMGRLDYDYKHEPIAFGWKDKHEFYGLGEFTKSVWDIPRTEKRLHPTMKPVRLISNAMKNSSKENDIIIDGFIGSGSTMVASHQLNRKCYGMEIDPIYCQVTIDRMKRLDPNIKVKKIT